MFIWCESESILKKIYLPNPQILKITFSSNKVSLNDRYLKINTFFARIYVVGGPLHTPFRYLIRRLISRLHWILFYNLVIRGSTPENCWVIVPTYPKYQSINVGCTKLNLAIINLGISWGLLFRRWKCTVAWK